MSDRSGNSVRTMGTDCVCSEVSSGKFVRRSWYEEPDYDAVLRVQDNQYYWYIKELNLLAKGADLDSAYRDLMERKQRLLDEFKEAGLLHRLPPLPVSVRAIIAKSEVAKELALFSLKTLIAVVLISGMVGMSGAFIVSSIAGMSPFKNLETELYRAADSQNELSPERREKLAASVRVVVQRIKPIVDEIRPLFSQNKEGCDTTTR